MSGTEASWENRLATLWNAIESCEPQAFVAQIELAPEAPGSERAPYPGGQPDRSRAALARDPLVAG